MPNANCRARRHPRELEAHSGPCAPSLERILSAHLRAGDRVAIEDPAFFSVIDLLGALGLIPVPVAIDDLGHAWFLERRYPMDWSRRTELVLPDHDQAKEADPLVGVHDELRLARLSRQKRLEQGKKTVIGTPT